MANDNAQGAIPFSSAAAEAELKDPSFVAENRVDGERAEQPANPPPTEGPDNKFAYPWGVDLDTDEAGETAMVPGTPGPVAGTPLDPQIAPNKFPRMSGSDTYSGIPGDGIIPG